MEATIAVRSFQRTGQIHCKGVAKEGQPTAERKFRHKRMGERGCQSIHPNRPGVMISISGTIEKRGKERNIVAPSHLAIKECKGRMGTTRRATVVEARGFDMVEQI